MKKLLALAAVLAFAVPAGATTARILAPQDWWPVWSPDGTHIAFTRVYANHLELWTLDLRTRKTVRIGSNAGQLGPTWSSDGSRLAYSSGGVLYTARPGGAGKSRYAAPLRSLAPAWRPGSGELAYLTTKGATNTDLWVGGTFWAANAIGNPAWSPDGEQLAFQRDDGIYLLNGPESGRRLLSVANPGPPAWSHDGTRIGFVAAGRLFTVTVPGGLKTDVGPASRRSIVPSWSRNDATVSILGAFAPTADAIVRSGGRPSCPGHVVLMEGARALTGSCLIAGTGRADVIEGTPLWGDAIEGDAGNDQIHANDGHTDRVDCGPGRDTVWADHSDELRACEIVHR